MSPHPVETVELRKTFFARYTDRDECQAAMIELRTLISAQFGPQVDTVAAGGEVTRMAVLKSQSSETKDGFPFVRT